jgi:hypothetical protein
MIRTKIATMLVKIALDYFVVREDYSGGTTEFVQYYRKVLP